MKIFARIKTVIRKWDVNGEKPLQNKQNRLVSATHTKKSVKQCVRVHDPEPKTAHAPQGRLSVGGVGLP